MRNAVAVRPAAADGREYPLACGRGSRLFLAGYASVKAIVQPRAGDHNSDACLGWP